MKLLEALKTIDLFADVAEATIAEIAALGSVKRYAKGDLVFSENSTAEEFYIVLSGMVAINKNVAGGRKRNLSNLAAGEVFGELALFDAQPRSADAEVIEDAEIAVLGNQGFLGLLEKDLSLAALVQRRIIGILCQRLRATDDMLKEGVIWGFTMDA